jgi:hypothetical protein
VKLSPRAFAWWDTQAHSGLQMMGQLASHVQQAHTNLSMALSHVSHVLLTNTRQNLAPVDVQLARLGRYLQRAACL